MTIITQIDDTNSKDGRLSIKSRVHCPIFDVTEDPVASPDFRNDKDSELTDRPDRHMPISLLII